MNKKAQIGHALLWLFRILMIIIVVGGVVAVILVHFSKQYDVRSVESAILSRQTLECFSSQGIFNREKFKENIIQACLNIDEQETFINISIESDYVEIGNEFLATLCQSQETGTKIKHYPSCVSRKYYMLEKPELNQVQINLFIAIRKVDKNL